MQPASQMDPVSKGRLWGGRVLTAVPVLFLVFDGVSHILKPGPVVEAFARLGFPLSLAVPLGILEFGCLAFYVFPRTATLGAILLTGYLGGAVASHVRVGDPLFDTIFPTLIGAMFWGGFSCATDGCAPFLLSIRRPPVLRHSRAGHDRPADCETKPERKFNDAIPMCV